MLVAEPALIAPSAEPKPKPRVDLGGAWAGRVSGAIPHQVCMEIPADWRSQDGTIVYFDGVSCVGRFGLMGSEGALHTFMVSMRSENPTDPTDFSNGGECSDAGRIDVSLNTDGSLAWAWFVIDANAAQITATLNPVSACSRAVTQSRTK